MSALDELKKKEIRTDLEAAVLSSAYYEAQATGFSGKSQTVYSEKAAKELAEKDAELLALRERVAKLERIETIAAEVNEWLKNNGLMGTAHQHELEAALKSQ